MDGHRDQVAPARPSPGWGWWLLALAGACIATGGRLELIREYGTSLPFRDEWKCTAIDLLGPWAQGHLHLAAFFAPLNDHWVVLTRLLSFGLARLNGQWNNLLETSINVVGYGAALWLFLGAIAPALGRRLGVAFVLYAGFVLALPYTWENTLWGIQSLVFFQIGLSVWYLWAIASRPGFSAGWWLGQLAGGLVLLTQHSSVLAYPAGALLLGWRWWRRDGDRRVLGAGLALAALWTALFFVFVPSLTVTAFHRAETWRLGLDVFLRQLAWPLPGPGWAFVVYLPFLWFVADRAARCRLSAGEGFVIAVGLWVGAQAAAIGYGRGEDTVGFVSRYCDFLALGFLVNAACLALLWRGAGRRALRPVVAALGVAWLGLTAPGLWHESVESHTRYNLERRPAVNAQNLAAIREYLATGDPRALNNEPVSETLYTYPPSLIELLQIPRFRSLLPPETGAREARRDYGRLGGLARWLPDAGRWLVLAGVLAAAGLFLGRPLATEPRKLPPSTWTQTGILLAWSVLTALAVGAFLAWRRPFLFNPEQRWGAAFAPGAENVEFIDPVFHPGAEADLAPGATRGAVATEPAGVRPFWYGTLVDGTRFTGVLHSEPAEIRRRFLFTPISGWPCWPGNGVRWRFENPATGAVQWRSEVCLPDEPGPVVAMWKEDVTPFAGWQASLYLFDGHAADHGWVGVARPAATDDPAFGRRWMGQLSAERAEPTHRVLAGLALFTLTAWLVQAGAWWRRRAQAVAAPGAVPSP